MHRFCILLVFLCACAGTPTRESVLADEIARGERLEEEIRTERIKRFSRFGHRSR